MDLSSSDIPLPQSGGGQVKIGEDGRVARKSSTVTAEEVLGTVCEEGAEGCVNQ